MTATQTTAAESTATDRTAIIEAGNKAMRDLVQARRARRLRLRRVARTIRVRGRHLPVPMAVFGKARAATEPALNFLHRRA